MSIRIESHYWKITKGIVFGIAMLVAVCFLRISFDKNRI